MNIVFLAAGRSSRIYQKIKKPKCLILIKKKTLIEKLILNCEKAKIKKISIITGFKSNLIKQKLKKIKKINYYYNSQFNKKDMMHSFYLALKNIDDDILISYSDILYNHEILKNIKKHKKNEILLPINKNWLNVWKKRNKNILNDGESLEIDNKNYLREIGLKIIKNKIPTYQYMGIIFIPKNLRENLIKIYKSVSKKNSKMHITKFLNLLIKKNFSIKCIKSNSEWYEFDDYEDFENYKNDN